MSKVSLLLSFFSFLLTRVESQQFSVCSEEGNSTCLESNRICLSNGTNEVCGNCTAGFIDFLAVHNDRGCQNISDLPWDEFYQFFKPLYRNDTGVTLADRLQRLYDILQYISEWMSQIPPPSYALGVNKFSADSEEDRKQLAGTRASANSSALSGFARFEVSNRRLQSMPAEVDWEAAGGTTYIKDQGRCGCCWAISNMGAVEGSAFVTEGWIQSLSFQQLISCDSENYGCDGGSIVTAMEYSVENPFGGLASLNDYPYEDEDGTTSSQCQTRDKNISVQVYNPAIVVTYSDNLSREQRSQSLKSATARQPVSVAMKSQCDLFSSYRGGVLTDDGDCACQSVTCVDHAVLLVGYNDNNNPPYWKLKNSWGDNWGEGGYFRISQEGGGQWGLFGLLGEGVIALKTVNTTGAEYDEPSGNEFTWWQILLIVLACLVGCCCIGGVLKALCGLMSSK